MAGEASKTNGTTNYATSNNNKLHIFFFPFLAPGHMIPMTDMAKLFASRGVKSTILATTVYEPSLLRSIEGTQKLGFDIGLLTMKLPLQEVGLPEECESYRSITTFEMRKKYFTAIRMLDKQLKTLIGQHRPNCLIADGFLPWATDAATELGVPRLVFHGMNHFSIAALECMRLYKPHLNISDDSEPFVIPNFPGEIKMTRDQLPDFFKVESAMTEQFNEIMESEIRSYGVIKNSFYELEPDYVNHYRGFLERRSWHVGPIFMCNKLIEEEKMPRAENERDGCLKWLDSKEPGSVVYVCFGSMTKFTDTQLHEIAFGLEASGVPFIWVVKKDEEEEEGKEEWLPQGYEDRMRGKGLIVRGWAPQVAILEHRAVGGFVTHCGWNSTLEAVSAGVPMVTWPVMAEQFFNEKFITDVMKIGVPVGVKHWLRDVGDSIESAKVEKAVRRIMIGEETEEMRARARELSELARKAVEEGGSSYSDLTAFLEELKSPKLVTH